MKKKFLSSMLALCMVIGMLPPAALAVEGSEDNTDIAIGSATTLPAAENGVITLTEDVTLAESFVVRSGETVILDLNGRTISGSCNASQGHLVMVEYGADLTIRDSSTEQTGKITYAQGTSNVGWTIDVEGDLILESGTIELTGSWSIGYAVDVRPNAWGTAYTEPTTFTMEGGKILSSDGAVRVASSSADEYSKVAASFTMNNGVIEAAWDGVFVQQSNAAWDTLSFTINDGTIKSAINPIRLYGPAATSYVSGEDCLSIALNGGTLTYTGDTSLVWLVDKLIRTGGGATTDEFLKDSAITASAAFASATVADGYVWAETEGGYQLAVHPARGKAAAIGDEYYDTFADAIDVAQDGDTITLLDDIVMTEDAAYAINFTEKAVSIDGNGHKITQAADCDISWALLYWQDNTDAVTVKNLTFEGIRGGAAIWAINTDVTVDNCVFQDGEYTQIQGLVRMTDGDLTVQNSQFLDNECNMAITFNFDLDSSVVSDDVLTVSDCIFEGNTCADTALIYYVKGNGSTIEKNTFTGNEVDSASHGSVLYYSEGANCTVTDNIFTGNTITAGGVRAGLLILEDSTVVSGNVFAANNTITSSANGTTYVAKVVCKADADTTAVDLSKNYWGDANEPDGSDYVSAKGSPIILKSYYSSNTNGTLDGLMLIGKAAIGDEPFSTLAAAIAAAQEGDTITLLGDIETSTYVTIDKPLTLNLNGYNITRTSEGTGLSVEAPYGSVVNIQGNGTIDTGLQALMVLGGTVNIYGGTFIGGEEAVLANYDSQISIYGGTFSSKQQGSNVLALGDDCTTAFIKVYGGTFANFDPADYVAEGYASVAGSNNTYTVVAKAVTGVSLNTNALSLTTGSTSTLSATVVPSDALNREVSWSSDNTAVATVLNGTVTAVAAGTTTITVTTSDGGFTATCNVTVIEPPVYDDSDDWYVPSTPTPTPTPTPTVPEAPKVDVDSPTVETETKTDETTGSTTTTETKQDGTKVETTTNQDGSSTTTASKTETKTDEATGSTTTTTATNTSTTTATGDKVTEEKVEAKVENTDGSTTTTTATNTTTETATGDKVTEEKVEEKVENKDGSTTTTTTTNTETKAADGTTETVKTEEKKVETEKETTTTTTTEVKNDTKTETIKTEEKTVTNEDGTTTTTKTTETDTKAANGSTGTTKTDETGKTEAEVKVSFTAVTEAAKSEAPVALPMPALEVSKQAETSATVTVTLPASTAEATVAIPVAEGTGEGTVAVLVNADGTETILTNAVITESGLVANVPNGATVKVVDNSIEFDDITDSNWEKDAVDFASSRNITNGTGEGFAPDMASSRAMVWTMLARLEGVDTTPAEGEDWWTAGQKWAMANGISDGTNADADITREQLAVMLYRYMGEPEHDYDIDHFDDHHETSDWARDSKKWAVGNKIINGKGNANGTLSLDPTGLATRGEVAQMLMNFIKNIKA